MDLAQRAAAIQPSPTMAIDALAKDMQAAGVDVASFGAGEPDFDTPEHIKQAAVQAIAAGRTKYTAAGGILSLKEAITAKLQRDNGLTYTPNQVVVSVGAKHALYNAFQVLCDPGDEVILPAPYWVSYEEQVRLAGGRAVIVNTQEANGFKLTAQELRAQLTPATRALILNTPSNPTGSVYSREELQALADAVLEHPRCVVISDEIYELLTYDNAKHVSIAALGEDIKARTLVINGVSKTYAMTGWRIGYTAGDVRVIKAMSDLQSHSTSNPASVAQEAAVQALNGPHDEVEHMRQAFAERRSYMLQRLQALPGVSCLPPGGAFYVFPRIDAAFQSSYKDRPIAGSEVLAELLLKEAHVALVPGTAFGIEGYARLSYAASMDTIRKGLDRLEAFWNGLLASG